MSALRKSRQTLEKQRRLASSRPSSELADAEGPEGFFEIGRLLGRFAAGGDEQAFWEQERDAVYAAWKRPLPK
jgi:hypothetical protein